MAKIVNKGKIDTSALDAEIAAASGRKSFKDGQKLKDIIVRQSKLPHGTIRFRALPPLDDMRGLPWVRTEEHFFYDKNTRAIASYLDTGRSDPGQRLADRMIAAGREKEGQQWKAKTTLRMNVIFTSWADGESAVPVPEECQGVRIFEFGRGVWRGTHKSETWGILKLLQDAQTSGQTPFFDADDGCEIEITKTGEGLGTNYKVELATNLTLVDVGGRKIQMPIPDVGPISPDPAKQAELLAARHNLQIFLRTKTMDEILSSLEPFERMVEAAEASANASKGKKPVGRAKSLQDELDNQDDLPF